MKVRCVQDVFKNAVEAKAPAPVVGSEYFVDEVLTQRDMLHRRHTVCLIPGNWYVIYSLSTTAYYHESIFAEIPPDMEDEIVEEESAVVFEGFHEWSFTFPGR